MVVRVRVRLKALKGREGEVVESVAILNSGYESKDPEVIIPVRLAERLGLWPRLPEGAEVESYEVAGGIEVRIYSIEGGLESQVIAEDEASNPIKTRTIIMEGQNEVLFSDSSISAHKIILEDVKAGLWRFKMCVPITYVTSY